MQASLESKDGSKVNISYLKGEIPCNWILKKERWGAKRSRDDTCLSMSLAAEFRVVTMSESTAFVAFCDSGVTEATLGTRPTIMSIVSS